GVAQVTPAFAHAVLIASDPGEGAVLADAPRAIALTFSESVEPTSLRLALPDGTVAELSDIASNGRTVVARGVELGEGTHILSWRVVSDDGHPVGGALTFSVGSASGIAALSTDPLLRPLIWLTRVALYIALFFGAAGTFFVAFV